MQSPERLEGVFVDEILPQFGGAEFFCFARSDHGLRLSEDDIRTAQNQSNWSQEQKMYLLNTWKMRNGSSATADRIRRLTKHFLEPPEQEWLRITEKIRLHKEDCLGNNVYRGEKSNDLQPPTPLAIKLVKYSENSLKEAKMLNRLGRHQNVVSIHEIGVHDGDLGRQIYMAMELCHTKNLHDTIGEWANSGEPFDSEFRISLARQIVAGLQYIHENNVVHRDLKPHNVLLCLNRRVPKIADFGVSKELKQGRTQTNQSRLAVGTDGYRAPETYNDDVITKRSDMYSLGIVIYILFSNGTHPFGKDPDEWNSMIKKNETPNLDNMLIQNSHLGKDAVQRMMNFIPKKRPSTKEVLAHPLFTQTEKALVEEPSTSGIRATTAYSFDVPMTSDPRDVPMTSDPRCYEDVVTEKPIFDVQSGAKQVGPSRQLKSSKSEVQDQENRNEGDTSILVFDRKSACLTSYKPSKEEWTPLTALAQCMLAQSFTATSVGQKVYVLIVTNDVYELDLQLDSKQWIVRPEMQGQHGWWHPVTVMGDCIYVVGCGQKMAQPKGTLPTLIERYQPGDLNWETVGHMQSERHAHAVVADKNLIYCIGGVHKNGQTVGIVECYNVDLGVWKPLPPINFPRYYAAATFYRGAIYLMGGERDGGDGRGGQSVLEAECYVNGMWNILRERINKRRTNFRALVVDDNLFMVGGNDRRERKDDQSLKNTIDLYDPVKDRWEEIKVMHDTCVNSWASVQART